MRICIIFFVACIIGFSSRARAQSVIPNGGFEQWDSLPGYGLLPVGWAADNAQDSLNPVFQSTDAHSGSFACGGRVTNDSDIHRNSPFLHTSDSITNGVPDIFVGFPITGGGTAFEGWYKLNSVGNDFLEVDLMFNNSGIAYFADTTTHSTYTHFSVPFVAPIPDSGTGSILIQLHGNHVGTQFVLDDLGLVGGVAVVPINIVSFVLEQNYPNPFNSSTTIRYSLPTDDHVTLEILNMLGERVALLEDGNEPAGEHQIFFNGELFPSGPYVCRFITASHGVSSNIIQLTH